MELDFKKDPSVLGDIVDAMAVGVFTVDAHGRFVAWSHGAERITGYSSEEVIGKACDLLEGPNCKGFGTLAQLLRTPSMAPGGICNQQCKVMAKEGAELYIHGNVRLMTDGAGSVVGAVGTFTDLTEYVRANEKIAILQRQAAVDGAFEKLVGTSRPMQEVFRRLKLAADSDVAVLITGESGTGKELAAQAIHAQSARSSKPFLAINCSALPESLLESELFGHVKGSFTGAVSDKLGLFEAAQGGTLFLDEIGDVSPAIQVKLLRVLQEREVRRVGDSRTRDVDIRLITATNRDLKQLMADGQIREDFYYRIDVFEIRLPPLRERKEDIPLLADCFIDELCLAKGRSTNGIARDALQRMMSYDWPGNVRQLRNAIEHACVTVSGDRITILDLPSELRVPNDSQGAGLHDELANLSDDELAERERIVSALRQTDGNRTQAAKLLSISRVTLWKKIGRYAIDVPD